MSGNNGPVAGLKLVNEESAGRAEDIVTVVNEKGDTKIVILRHYCKGCDICAEVCPKDVLNMAIALDRWEGTIVEVIDIDACNSCMLCEYQCPDFAIEVYNDKKEKKAREKKELVKA